MQQYTTSKLKTAVRGVQDMFGNVLSEGSSAEASALDDSAETLSKVLDAKAPFGAKGEKPQLQVHDAKPCSAVGGCVGPRTPICSWLPASLSF